FKGAKIPTLKEVFELFLDTDMTINIELKTGIMFYSGIEEKTIALTEEYGFMNRVIFSSFNHLSVKKIKELRPEAKCGFLYADGTIGMPEYAKLHGMEALHPALYNLQYEGFMKECKEKNIEVNVWTVDEEEYIKFCCMLGVDSIITNCPDKVFAVIEGMAGSKNE
ncbi:MAG: glycerophosphodiester phosphodiesterase, partial [[Eubacterium] sulci]|nr:glycerophosphodiester phosphodiesterase [[Eubacterium] sulci]